MSDTRELVTRKKHTFDVIGSVSGGIYRQEATVQNPDILDAIKRAVVDNFTSAAPSEPDADTPRWIVREGWEYHAQDCTAYNSEILSCDCGLDAHLAAQTEVDSEGHLELYNLHTQLLIRRDELIADNTRLRDDLVDTRENMNLTDESLIAARAELAAEREHADFMANTLDAIASQYPGAAKAVDDHDARRAGVEAGDGDGGGK